MTELQTNTLISINEAICSVQEPQKLISIINENTSKILKFDSTCIMIVDESGEFNYDLEAIFEGRDIGPASSSLKQIFREKIPHQGSILEWIINDLKDEALKIYKYEDLNQLFPNPLFAEMIEDGITNALSIVLTFQGKILGVFFINLQDKDFPEDYDERTLESLGNAVAIAVNNILAKEKILKSEKEYFALLEISKVISREQNPNEFWENLVNLIHPLLRFKASVTTLYNADYTHYKYYLAKGNFHDIPEFNIESIMNRYFPFEGTSDYYVYKQGDVCLLSSKEKEKLAIFNKPTIDLLNSLGVTDNLYIKLKSRGRVIGVQHFHFGEPIPDEKVKLSTQITEFIAIGVDNIISKEEILERELEKSNLLEISSGITLVKTRKELVTLISEKVQPLFPFDNVGLFLFDWTTDKMEDILNSRLLEDEIQNMLENKDLFGAWSLGDSNSNSWWMKRHITIGLIADEAMYSKGKKWEGQFKAGYDHGLRSFIGGPLISKGEVIGAICFYSKKEDFYKRTDEPLFKSISEQLATALSNIISFETIKKKEQENKLLIEINELIASVKSPDKLLEIILNKIKPHFNFYDCGLFVLDKGLEYHVDWAVDRIDLSPSDWNIALNETVQKYRHANSPLSFLIEKTTFENKPVIVDFLDLVERFPDYPQFTNFDIIAFGYRDCLGYHLKIDGIVKGFFCINALEKGFFKVQDFQLFQSICHAVSIAVKNILEHQHLKQVEYEKSFQVALNGIFSSQGKWNDKWLHFGQSLKNFVPFDFMLVQTRYQEKDQVIGIEKIGYQEYRVLGNSELMKIMDINSNQLDQILKVLSEVGDDTFIFEKLQKLKEDHPIVRLLFKLKSIHSLLNFKVEVSPHVKYNLTLLQNKNEDITQEHLDFLTRIAATLKLCLEKNLAYDEIKQLSGRLELEKEYLMEEVQSFNNLGEIIGASQGVLATLKAIGKVAKTDATVLIEGETGTGKELIARAIHQRSGRNDKPLIKVNCASLPPQLIESELFGHEKGAFTGATDRRIGKFELANKGTLFLDEIGELPLELQPKLLRALQEREIERVGGTGTISCDVRIVAATNRNLEEEVRKGNFRADLFYRLNVFPLNSTPLRERKIDIPELCRHFSVRFAKKLGKNFEGFSKNSVDLMTSYSWPGNIRELQNVIEQAMITSEGNLIDCEAYFKGKVKKDKQSGNPEKDSLSFGQSIAEMNRYLEAMERNHILQALKNTNYRIRGEGGAAEILDVHPNTLESKLKKLGIKKQYS